MEGLLGDIANRLAGIEGMYEDVASRLVANERTVRELRVTGGGGGAKGVVMTPGRPVMSPPTGHSTPPRGSLSLNPNPNPGGLTLPHQQQQPIVTATVQQHSSQIHKLIAGLDFLEQHIIRHDAGRVLIEQTPHKGKNQAPQHVTSPLIHSSTLHFPCCSD